MNHKLFEKHVFLLFLALLPIGLSASATPAKQHAQGVEDYFGTISFEDNNVKEICVANWDTDYDGSLSYEEAAAVTNLGLKFRGNTSITTFDELQYFTGLSEIDNYAFQDCSNLTKITLPNSVISIGMYAFEECSNLASISIPDGVTHINYDAFHDCSSLSSVEIPNSVVYIGHGAFSSCSSLTSITIPSSVQQIDFAAFYFCGLTSIDIPNSVLEIGERAFYGCTELTSIEIPSSVISIGNAAFGICYNVSYIHVDTENTVYDSRNECNAIIETSTNRLISGCNNTIIPNGVTRIEEHAFEYCYGMSSISIPNSVTSIGNFAFYNCSGLTSFTIPHGVTSIGEQAFYYCSKLKSIVSKVEVPFAFGGHAFNYISDNCVLTVPYGTRDAYIAAGWTEDVFKGGVVEAALEPIKIVMETSSGEARKAMGYSSQYGLDFTDVTDVKAYIASGYTDEGVVLLSRVNIVPPYTGIYLTTEDAGVTVEVPVTYKNTCYANLLYPIVTEQTVEPNVTVGGVDYMTFAVGVLAESDEMGFVKLNASRTMGPNKCILRVPARYYPTEARSMGGFKMMFTDEEATGVDHISTNSRTADDCYDLQGRKVKANEMKQGLYIINGKKVWVK